MSEDLRLVLWVLLLLLVLYWIFKPSVPHIARNNPSKIAIVGEAQQQFQPDAVEIILGIRKEGSNPSLLQQQVQHDVSNLVGILHHAGFDKVTTENFTMDTKSQSFASNGSPPQTPPTFVMTNSLRVQTVPNQVGKLMDTIKPYGINLINMNWDLKDSQKQENHVRLQAIRDAQFKAAQTASALHQKLGRILSFNENNYGIVYPRAMPQMFSAATTQNNTNIPAGQIQIHKTVNIEWELL